MKKTGKIITTLMLMLIILASCSTRRIITSDGVTLRGEAQLQAIINNTPVFDYFSSRLKLTLSVNGEDMTLNGTLKMKWNEIIQISLHTPVIRTEAARIEIFPEKIVILDRINKIYVSAPLSELENIFHTNVDYPMLQSLFANRMFLPGKTVETRTDLLPFGIKAKAEEGVVLSRKTNEYLFSFFASNVLNRLTETTIENRSERYQMQWKYDSFIPVSNITFPSEITVLIGNNNRMYRSFMELSRLSVDKINIKPVSVSSRYEEVSLDVLLKMLLSI